MDVIKHDFRGNSSEKETAILFQNMGLECVDLNWKMRNDNNVDEGEIDGIFLDPINQIYIIYDDSIKKEDRQDKVSKFLNKWKIKENKDIIRKTLELKDYPIYVIYIDKSQKEAQLDSINYVLDDFTKIIYTEDYYYFEKIYNVVGKWVRNDFYNYLDIKPRETIKKPKSATQIWIGNTPAFVFADRVENILNYSFISRRKNNSGGYQRLIDKKRVDRMAILIQSDKIKAFPNSILLNCIDDINFIPKQKSDCPCNVEFDLPSNFSSCKVVDGQHRLLAFSKLDPRIQDSHSLPIVLFQKMPLEEEIQTFIEINDSQKGIDPNLIYSLKADLKFQVGTKENREKVAVEIAKKLDKAAAIFKENVFFGNAGEDRKKKITLTTIVQSILDFKIVDSNRGFLQKEEQDNETPFQKIKEFINILRSKDSSNDKFYKSNNGIQLILKYISFVNRNIDKGNISITIEFSIDEFIKSINKNKISLEKKYGKAGFSAISNLILGDIKNSAKEMTSMEIEIKKLK